MIELEKLEKIKNRFDEIEQMMADPEIATDAQKMSELGQEHGQLREVIEAINTYENLLNERKDLKEMVASESGEMADLAQDELESLNERLPEVEDDLKDKLIPKDPEDRKDSIIEIRAGTGGDEAAIFAGDLYRMYVKYAEKKGWGHEVIDASHGSHGGFKEITMSMSGPEVFGTMKYESGVHRVQRVPETESSGRIHTSAASVAVLPEAEEVDIDIKPNEIKVDTYRASGPGGQSVNTTDSAIRITHLPSKLVVTCQDEKSQHKNRDKAMRVLRSRLYEMKLEKQREERAEERRSQIGSGDRSAKIRTYNFPQDRVTDHRMEGDNKNYALQDIIEGDLDPVLDALKAQENAERLAQL